PRRFASRMRAARPIPRAVCDWLGWKRGTRGTPRAMPDVRTLADQLWRGEIDTLTHPPVGGLTCPGEEIAPGVLFYKGVASANTIDTGAGLVMLDTGSRAATRPLHEAVRRWRPAVPLAAAAFSHHHIDPIFGVAPSSARPTIAPGPGRASMPMPSCAGTSIVI